MINPMVLSPASVVVASNEQISCDVADEAVLLSMQSGEYYGLNAVGASIWRLIQQPRAVPALCDALQSEYDIDPSSCASEVLGFLTEMLALGLVEVRS
ncbi:MAG TPA: PqqD family peptide modification chaperone [Gemmatimonadaceae bacterium]|nr:PqqD family peptide modification chaperone [Gemmatimonadaceae bacterium]